MFFKSKEQRDKEAYDRAMMAAVKNLPTLTSKWKYFCENVPLKAEIPLLERVKIFTQPASKWAHDYCPDLVKTDNPLPWFFMLFSAVRSAETHTDAELDEAMVAFEKETGLPALQALVNVLPREIGH